MDHARLTATPRGGAVWITRAQPGAAETARAVAALGLTPVVEPLVEVRPLPASAPDLAGVAVLAFTSAAGVRAFADLHGGRDLPVFTVGDATAEAARAAGWRRVTSAGGDVRALDAVLVEHAPRGRVLAPGALRPAGALPRAERLAVYETAATPGPWPAAQAALEAGNVRSVLLHSASAGRALAASGLASRRAEVLALSLACASMCDARLWARVRTAARPEADALLALLASAPAPWQAPEAPL